MEVCAAVGLSASFFYSTTADSFRVGMIDAFMENPRIPTQKDVRYSKVGLRPTDFILARFRQPSHARLIIEALQSNNKAKHWLNFGSTLGPSIFSGSLFRSLMFQEISGALQVPD